MQYSEEEERRDVSEGEGREGVEGCPEHETAEQLTGWSLHQSTTSSVPIYPWPVSYPKHGLVWRTQLAQTCQWLSAVVNILRTVLLMLLRRRRRGCCCLSRRPSSSWRCCSPPLSWSWPCSPFSSWCSLSCKFLINPFYFYFSSVPYIYIAILQYVKEVLYICT